MMTNRSDDGHVRVTQIMFASRECPVPAEAWQTLQLLVSEPQRLQALANSSGAAFSSPGLQSLSNCQL